MDLPGKEIIDLLTYLLPGFIAAAVLFNLTPSPRPATFERLVQALIFTILIQVGVLLVEWTGVWIGEHGLVMGVWSEDSRLVWSVVLAIALGVSLARFTNHDTLHRVFRRWRITFQTSYSSEWYGAFSQNNGYVVLHLGGQRRIYGWPEEWPSTPDRGHFVIAQAEWLDGDNGIPLEGFQRILVRAQDVEMVELMSFYACSPSASDDWRT